MFYVREITVSKWEDGSGIVDILLKAADLVTGRELRTVNNTLSWWKIDSPDELLDVACAMYDFTCTPKTKNFILLPAEQLDEIFSMVNAPSRTEAVTRMPEMRTKHYNMAHLTTDSLIGAGSIILSEATSGNLLNVKRSLIKNRISELGPSRFELDGVSPRIISKLFCQS